MIFIIDFLPGAKEKGFIKKLSLIKIIIFAVSAVVMMIPAMAYAQSEGPPPIGQQLVREGTFAIQLESALGVGTTEDEVEAESRLGELGIAPRNGWIADYPVTPDIIGELQKAVGDAADANKLSLDRDEALKRLNDVTVSFGLPVTPHAGGMAYGIDSSGSQNYPNPAEINDYYSDEGPPVVTYYYPPPDYYYLYAWIPFPFWYSGFWFPGFFVLHDFHRTIIINRQVFFVSNHFNDVRIHRVFRIDPVARFNGKTFAGIGVSRTKGFISTGIPKSDRKIFNVPRERMAPGGRMVSPPSAGSRVFSPPAREGKMESRPSPEGRVSSPPSGKGRVFSPPAHEGKMETTPAPEGRVSSPPARDGETGGPHTGGGGFKK